MKVVHVNVSDTKGGAARAAFRLHEGLRHAGLDSSMVVAEKYSDDEHVTVPVHDRAGYYERRLHYRQLTARFWRYALSRPPGLSPFTDPSTRRNRDLVTKLPNADVINLHWIAHFVDQPTFLTQCQTPLVWTLHDMNAFTGGCHYALDCDLYLKRCGRCPQLGSRSNQDVSRKIWMVKKKTYQLAADNKLHFVTPSNWLAAEARRSSLLHTLPITVISNGLDTDVFRPYDKSEARRKFGIPVSAKVLLFVADSVLIRRKGLGILLSALEDIDDHSNILLVSLGAGSIRQNWPVPTMSLGHLTNELQIAQAYSAADLFVLPSLQDNLPNTVMEALACGTPVVGFNVGGIPDMVRPGFTGQLVTVGDFGQLRQTILALLDDEPLRAEMSLNGRLIAEKEYSLGVQAAQYISLYRRILDSEASSK